MTNRDSQFSEVLERAQNGDPKSMSVLMDENLRHIQAQVRKQLRDLGSRGQFLRQKIESGDIVQQVAIRFVRYGPKISLSTPALFRSLIATIVRNTLKDQIKSWLTARRNPNREEPLDEESPALDLSRNPTRSPLEESQRNEEKAWIRLGLEFLGSVERQIILLRDSYGWSFDRIGETLGISSEAARKRHKQALIPFSEVVGELRRGQLEAFLESQNRRMTEEGDRE